MQCILADANQFVVFVVEMETNTRASILEIKYMDLAYITLQMAIAMKGHGMKVENKAMACTRFEMVTQGPANGTLAILELQLSQ